MNDQFKPVSNPLFNAAVTGGTFEDFSQNVVLLPVQEKPPAPVLKLTPEEILNDIIPNKNLPPSQPEQLETAQLDPIQQEPVVLPDPSSIQPHLASNHNSSNLSSVFSSFSNILNIRSSGPIKEDYVAPPPAGIETLIGYQNSNPEPVPLFSPSSAILTQPSAPPPPAGSVNAFRRTGIKRPTYAPVPGLSHASQAPSQFQTPYNPFTPSTTQLNSTSAFPPNISPTNSTASNASTKELPHPNHFKPISTPPPVADSGYPVAQPLPINQPFSPIPHSQLPQSKSFSDINTFHSHIPIDFNISHSQTCSQIDAPPLQSQGFTSQQASLFQEAQSSATQVPLFHPPPSANQPQIPLFQPSAFPNTVSNFPFPQPKRVHTPQLLNPSVNKSLQGPVMDAIPPSELLQNSPLSVEVDGATTASNNIGANNGLVNQTYRPVYHHWFFQKESEGQKTWYPFSMVDSLTLDGAFTSSNLDPEKFIPTEGGRYDVNILRRQRMPIYWKGEPSEVRRCSWFYKDVINSRLIPYEENVATRLEEEYKQCYESNQWRRRIELADGEVLEMHAPDVLVLFPRASSPDAWGNTTNQPRPRTVKRGMDEFHIDEGESAEVDHILFMVHGIGSVCDLKFKSVEETVDEFRNIALQLVRGHYSSSCEAGKVNRVEILPISWHDKLHSEETGVDQHLKNITLESIPKLRHFTNDTILDVLFYTSPIYCQNIISAVGNELNRIYDLYKTRNPHFKGDVSLGGHSLGSLILFDLLCNQTPTPEEEEPKTEVENDIFVSEDPKEPTLKRKISRKISYVLGHKGTGQPQIYYPHLHFEPKTFFALGSPIGMFIIIRGLDTLGDNFSLPTCPGFFNIFHPYDPIAYRMESLLNLDLGKLKPVLIPHHKGRKRLHLELKETMARVGADLKQKVLDSIKSTWDSVYQLAKFHTPDHDTLEKEVQKAIDNQMEIKGDIAEEPVQDESVYPPTKLNRGRRIDYVLQEAPFEIINEYLFALTSHVCYWESEDTILMMLKEIYSALDITPDSQLPPQTMTIERPPPSPTSLRSQRLNSLFQKPQTVGMDPTQPMQMSNKLQPPPTSGFVRKT